MTDTERLAMEMMALRLIPASIEGCNRCPACFEGCADNKLQGSCEQRIVCVFLKRADNGP